MKNPSFYLLSYSKLGFIAKLEFKGSNAYKNPTIMMFWKLFVNRSKNFRYISRNSNHEVS